jgi:hypothetical protein
MEYDIREYHASTLPGHHLLHARLEKNGESKGTRDLLKNDKVVIFANDDAWRGLKRYSEMVQVVVIGDAEDQWKDIEGMWQEIQGVSATGAVIVRPDGIVCWRWKDGAFLNTKDLNQQFGVVIQRILRRER